MQTIVFDVMSEGRFIMQFKYRWCPAFKLNIDDVVKEILAKRPTLKGKSIELYQTNNIVL